MESVKRSELSLLRIISIESSLYGTRRKRSGRCAVLLTCALIEIVREEFGCTVVLERIMCVLESRKKVR